MLARAAAFTLPLTLALALPPRPALAAELRKGPYLQHLGPTDVDIRVELAAPAPLKVTFAAEPDDGGTPFVRTATSREAAFHSVHLDGLVPGTRYRYAVQIGKTTREGSFVTAPASDSHKPFSFIIYGDSRSDAPAHARIVDAIAKETFDFLVETGDMVVSGADEAGWQSFFDVEEPLLSGHCLFAAIGNHELHDDRTAEHFERYFAPTEPIKGLDGEVVPAPLYGSFRWGRARFFLLNAFEDWSPGRERAWLERSLAEADHEPNLDVRVVVLHHGPYSAGPHGNNKDFLAQHIDEILTTHHVDLVISGHDHIYERGQAGALKYLVSGGAGAPLYREMRPLPSTRKLEATYHYVVTTVSDDGVTVTAKRPDGSLVDQCTFALGKGSSWTCDPAKTEIAPAPSGDLSPPPAAHSGTSAAGMCGCDVPGRSGTGRAGAGVLAAALAAGALSKRRRASSTRRSRAI